MGRSTRPAPCHPHRMHKAREMCGPCYNVWALGRNPVARAHVKKYMSDRHLRLKFGITRTEFDRMVKAQGGVCKLCGDEPNGRWPRLQVDHDHKTGRIRGLLCWFCNYRIVGRIEKSPGMLKRLEEYLQ
jgi:hypothetical protein